MIEVDGTRLRVVQGRLGGTVKDDVTKSLTNDKESGPVASGCTV